MNNRLDELFSAVEEGDQHKQQEQDRTCTLLDDLHQHEHEHERHPWAFSSNDNDNEFQSSSTISISSTISKTDASLTTSTTGITDATAHFTHLSPFSTETKESKSKKKNKMKHKTKKKKKKKNTSSTKEEEKIMAIKQQYEEQKQEQMQIFFQHVESTKDIIETISQTTRHIKRMEVDRILLAVNEKEEKVMRKEIKVLIEETNVKAKHVKQTLNLLKKESDRCEAEKVASVSDLR